MMCKMLKPSLPRMLNGLWLLKNVEEGIWEDITSPEIHAKVTAIQEANITRIETKEVEEEAFEHDQWLNVTEGESWADIDSREIPLVNITVFEVARNLQWSDQVDVEYEKTQIQQTSERIHSVENHAEKVSRDIEMKRAGVWCLHQEQNMREFQARSRSTRAIFFTLRYVGLVPSHKNVGKPTKAAANVPAESIFCLKI